MFMSILHPTTLTSEGIDAFAHALRIALDAEGRLTVLHISGDKRTPWTEFPGIRDTLVRWGKLDAGASRDEVGKIGLNAVKLRLKGTGPVKGILRRASRSDSDLLVLAAHRRDGISRFISPSNCEPVVRQANVPSLILPMGCRGFVDIRLGTVALRRVVVVVSGRRVGVGVMLAVVRLLETLDVRDVEIGILRVGKGQDAQIELPRSRPGWSLVELSASGGSVGAIVDQVSEWQAGVLALTTWSRRGPLDALRGSVVERVVRQVRCPVLAVPESM